MDEEAFRANLRAWLAEPIAGVVVGGSTGEAPFLRPEELARLVALAREVAGDRLVVAGTGAESTRDTLAWTEAAAGEGADGVLVRPPAYYRDRMTPEALREHFTALVERSPVPVILYHMPRYVPVDLVPELVGELARHERIVAIKDSSGDLRNLGALCEACEDRARVLVGSGSHLYPALELGASGGILAVGLAAPALCCELVEAFRAGRTAEAGRLQERIGPLNKVVVGAHGVAGLKLALDLLGLKGGPARRPLRPPSNKAAAEIERALRRAGLLGPRSSSPAAAPAAR